MAEAASACSHTTTPSSSPSLRGSSYPTRVVEKPVENCTGCDTRENGLAHPLRASTRPAVARAALCPRSKFYGTIKKREKKKKKKTSARSAPLLFFVAHERRAVSVPRALGFIINCKKIFSRCRWFCESVQNDRHGSCVCVRICVCTRRARACKPKSDVESKNIRVAATESG